MSHYKNYKFLLPAPPLIPSILAQKAAGIIAAQGYKHSVSAFYEHLKTLYRKFKGS